MSRQSHELDGQRYWIQTAEGNREFLESIGVEVGAYEERPWDSGGGCFNDCIVPHEALRDLWEASHRPPGSVPEGDTDEEGNPVEDAAWDPEEMLRYGPMPSPSFLAIKRGDVAVKRSRCPECRCVIGASGSCAPFCPGPASPKKAVRVAVRVAKRVVTM